MRELSLILSLHFAEPALIHVSFELRAHCLVLVGHIWCGHLGCRVKITDTLKLNCLRWLNPQLPDREIQRDRLLLSECRGERELAQSGQEVADLLSIAITDLGNGFHVDGHFIFVGAGRGNSSIVF